MNTHKFTMSQYLPRPRDRIFSFFEKAENLALITPRWLGFQVLSTSPVEIYEGRLIDYQIRLSGVPVHWRSLISRYDPPTFFVDEQVIGPHAIWRHLHRFESVLGGTRLIDEIEYRLPDWIPRHSANLINHIYTKPRLKQIFAYRKTVFANMFGNPLRANSENIKQCDLTIVRETAPCA